jgi:hypothetical protein
MWDIPIDKPMDYKWIIFVIINQKITTHTLETPQMNNEDPYWASWT